MAAELVQLQPGQQVDQWTIVKKLGEGGFGAVYKVTNGSGEYALKVEGANEQIQVLKMEVYVLTEVGKRNGRHFCKIEDKGHSNMGFNWICITFVGKSLQDLRKVGPGQHLSMGSAIGVSIQALEALEDLHGIGYLHRDVKPGNYTVGRPELNELRKVYVLDFGMARKFTNDQGVIRKPRAAAGFRGTVRYAPLSCHLQRELCRKDDVESWLYMAVELTTGNLPWKNVQDMNQVGDYKKRCRQEPYIKELFTGCPREYMEILQITDSLKYYDAPNYQFVYNLMRKALVSMNVSEFPYDWEKPGGGAF
uniref:non-specific serine/threonine protein kinase n=1 Tax=Parastrongyloides trichosuri TaxID=131310 RepID=A0A0N4ZY13_PARTI